MITSRTSCPSSLAEHRPGQRVSREAGVLAGIEAEDGLPLLLYC